MFNALHGRCGEDGCVQGLLELLGIPYTHSGVLASAVAMDKPSAKRVVAAAGVRAPEGHARDPRRRLPPAIRCARPYVVKPITEGSTVGVRIVADGDNAPILGRRAGPSASTCWSSNTSPAAS